MLVRVLVAGSIAGILSNITGYVITGRLFHPYQSRTPGTWRPTENWSNYLFSTGIRLFACFAVTFLYGFVALHPAGGPLVAGTCAGFVLWAVTVAPVILEVALFVNWHRGFVVGLLLDWLIVFVLAGIAGAVAARPV